MNKTVICHVQNQTSNAKQVAVVFCPAGAVTANPTAKTEVMKKHRFAVRINHLIDLFCNENLSKLIHKLF